MQGFGIVSADGRVRELADDPYPSRGETTFRLASLDGEAGRATLSYDIGPTARVAPTSSRGWVGGYGLQRDVTSDGNAQGFRYGYGGTTFGVDHYVGGNTVVDLTGGYAASQVKTDTRQQSSSVDSLQGAVYATRVVDRHYVLGIVGYSHDDYGTSRAVPSNLIAQGDFNGDQIGTYLESGLLRQWGSWNWQPSIGLQYIHLRQDAFTETGAGGAGLSVAGIGDNSLRGSLGLRFTRPTPVGSMLVIRRSRPAMAASSRMSTASSRPTSRGSWGTPSRQRGTNWAETSASSARG